MKLHYLLLCTTLAGCATEQSPLESQHQATLQQIVALEESLPPECKTAPIATQLDALALKATSDYRSCKRLLKDSEEKLQAERVKFVLASILFVVAFGLLILKTIRK